MATKITKQMKQAQTSPPKEQEQPKTNPFEKLAVELFQAARDQYTEAAKKAELDEETTLRFLQAHGMEVTANAQKWLKAGASEPVARAGYAEAMQQLAYDWLNGGAADLDQQREVVRDCILPEWLEKRETEMQVRNLLDLPPCPCGEGLSCPEIRLNMIGHPNEIKVKQLMHWADENGDPLDEPEF